MHITNGSNLMNSTILLSNVFYNFATSLRRHVAP
nr:MAG TPA: hypothetical protein [Caudoviricetes sp.]